MCISKKSGKESGSKRTNSNWIIRAFVYVLLISCCLLGLAVNSHDDHIINEPNRVICGKENTSVEEIKTVGSLQNPVKRSVSLDEMNHVILKKSSSLQLQMNQINTIYEIRYEFDLKNRSVSIPEGCILKFEGGCIRNGILIGNNTGIVAQNAMIFDSVTIKGTWEVPEITSKWFKCVNDNDLVQAFNLLSDYIENTITVEDREEDYWVDCQVGGTLANPVGILNLKSNTRCVVNGTIRQRGHHSNHIHLFLMYEVENVILEGNGTIHGEKELHNYRGVTPIMPVKDEGKKRTHEHNHIIQIQKSKNVIVRGLSLKDSTGDGIDIHNYNRNMDNHIVVDNFAIDNCSRQGISVTGSFIEIKNGTISNINRTMPMAGIDIEISISSNTRIANNIVVENVTIFNCYTGLVSTTPQEAPANMHDFTFRDVKCHNVNRGFSFTGPIKNVSIINCSFDIIPSLDTRTLNYSVSDNFIAEGCSIICDDVKCRESWGWPGITPKGKQSSNSLYTAENDFTLLRTYSNSTTYRNNKACFRGCKFYSPYTNLIKRANKNTIIDNCNATCLYLNVVNGDADSIIRNSQITILDDDKTN